MKPWNFQPLLASVINLKFSQEKFFTAALLPAKSFKLEKLGYTVYSQGISKCNIDW